MIIWTYETRKIFGKIIYEQNKEKKTCPKDFKT